MHKRAHTRRKPVRARFVAHARENASCTCACAPIFMKLIVVVHWYLMSLSIKFHADPSFGCRDICKTIMTFVWSLIFYIFCMFSNLSIKIPSKCENYTELVGTYGNFISKCPVISENMAPILAHMVLLNRSYSKMILYQSLWITLYEHEHREPCIDVVKAGSLCVIGLLYYEDLKKVAHSIGVHHLPMSLYVLGDVSEPGRLVDWDSLNLALDNYVDD